MCHHRGDIPGEIREWTMGREETAEVDEEEKLPAFLNEEGEEVSVLTDGSGGD